MRRLLAIALILCVGNSAHANALVDCLIKTEQCSRMVGKRLWVLIPAGNPNVVEVTFSRGDWATSRTLKLKTGASFVVTGLDKGSGDLPEFKIKLDDGRLGWADRSIFVVDYDPIARANNAVKECARRGQPKIGMTAAELVQTCWQKPSRIVKKTTSAGTEEAYIYAGGRAAKLIDGKVSEIIEMR